MLFSELEYLVRALSLESASLSKVGSAAASTAKFFDRSLEKRGDIDRRVRGSCKHDSKLITLIGQQRYDSGPRTNLDRKHLQRIDAAVLEHADSKTVDYRKLRRFVLEQL